MSQHPNSSSSSNSNNNNKRIRTSESLNEVSDEISEPEGVVLEKLLNGSRNSPSWNEFLSDIWQTCVFALGSDKFDETVGDNKFLLDNDKGRWRDQAMKCHPWKEMVTQGPHILANLLQTAQFKLAEAKQREFASHEPPKEYEIPLIFQNRRVLNRDQVQSLYGDNLFAAYLDGCSIVLNHADLLSPWFAYLCEDLQQAYFPHAYANCYLTPPGSQTAPPHADDRDVLIFQLVGQKEWQVYAEVPIPYPYPHEQVGKDGKTVPPSVLQGPKAFDDTLHPGDVLYLPRGMVHQARSTDNAPSFHITVALATHDWTLAGNLSRQIQKRLMQTIDYRKSLLPLSISNREEAVNILQSEVNLAMATIQRDVTAEKLLQDLETRVETHNRTSFSARMALIHAARIAGEKKDQSSNASGDKLSQNRCVEMGQVVGPEAAQKVTYSATIRAATPEERAFAQGIMAASNNNAPGLNVREDIADTIMALISSVKASENGTSFKVVELQGLAPVRNPLICDLTLLCLAKRAVELGAFALCRPY
jgi:hypothetical protein